MAQTVKDNLGQALRLMLKPLAKLLIAQGITHREFSEAAKEAFVEMALRHYSKGKKINRSRAAIVTGLTRKEVSYVISRALSQDVPERNFSRPGRVLHGWHNDPDYTGPYGMPLEIPYDSVGKDAQPPSFVHLVKVYSGDQSPKQMLDEMLRVGAILKVDSLFKAVRRDFEAESLSPKLIQRFGDLGFNLLTTMSSNIQKTDVGKGIFDRAVTSNQKLTKIELDLFEKYLKSRGQLILEEIDGWLTANVSTKTSNELSAPLYESGLAMLEYIVYDPEEKQSLREFLFEAGVTEVPDEEDKQ